MKDNPVSRRRVLNSVAAMGSVTVAASGVVGATDEEVDTTDVPYQAAVEGRHKEAYAELLTDDRGNVTFENVRFDQAEIAVTRPRRGRRVGTGEFEPTVDLSEYDGPPRGLKVFHGKYKNAEPLIDPTVPEAEQQITPYNDTLRSGRQDLFEVPSIVPGVGGCTLEAGYDVDFQLSPAKYADVSVGVGLCGNYVEIAGFAVGYLSDEYFCVSPPRNLPIDVSGCGSANWTSDDELEISLGISLAVPPNNPCSPAKCQVQRDFTLDWSIGAP